MLYAFCALRTKGLYAGFKHACVLRSRGGILPGRVCDQAERAAGLPDGPPRAVVFLILLIGIHPCEGRPCPVAKNIRAVLQSPYQKIEDSVRKTMEGITLQSMIDDFHRLAQENPRP